MLTSCFLKKLLCVVAISIVVVSTQIFANSSDDSSGQRVYFGYLGSYKVLYAGGRVKRDPVFPIKLKSGDKLTLQIGSTNAPVAILGLQSASGLPVAMDDRDKITLFKSKNKVADYFSSSDVTEISFGLNVPQRVGAVIGEVVPPGKPGNRYIGLTWTETGDKCGVVFQVEENDFDRLLSALQRFTGKKAVDSDKP